MHEITFPNGDKVPALGQGTWHMGQSNSDFKSESNSLCAGLDLGLKLIDTAEMYHDAELVVASAIKGRRDDAYLVSKVLPSNASMQQTMAACERSLQRLGAEYLDLYLLHWSGPTPIEETLAAFVRLQEQGKIRGYGVSNLDTDEISAAWDQPGGNAIQTNQVLYNLHHRGIEWDLLPWCRNQGLPVMAYSPLNQGDLAPEVLDQVAHRHNATRFQIALAWTLQQPGIISIPKAASVAHIEQNLAACEIEITHEELKQIHRAFPPPKSAAPLEVI